MKIEHSSLPQMLIIALATSSLISCSGVAIPVKVSIPAEINLGRGSIVAVDSSSADMPSFIAGNLKDRISKEGFYRLTNGNDGDFHIFVSNENRSELDLYQTNVSIRRNTANGPVVASKTLGMKDTAYSFWNAVPIVAWFTFYPSRKSLAPLFHDWLAPHEEEIYVKAYPETPELKDAVNACVNGHWEKAEKITRQAMEKYPNDSETLFIMGIIESKNMNYDASDELLKRAYSMKQDKRYMRALENNVAARKNDAAVIQQLSAQ